MRSSEYSNPDSLPLRGRGQNEAEESFFLHSSSSTRLSIAHQYDELDLPLFEPSVLIGIPDSRDQHKVEERLRLNLRRVLSLNSTSTTPLRPSLPSELELRVFDVKIEREGIWKDDIV